MGSFFKFGQVVPEILAFECSKKRGFFQQDLEGSSLHIWNGTRKKNFEGYFHNFLGINTHNFVKKDPKFENKSLFDATFYGAWYENIFRSQNSNICGLGPKN